MKVLSLSARLPYPLDTGAKIRAYHILKAIAAVHDVTLLSFVGSREEDANIQPIRKLGVRVQSVVAPEIDQGMSLPLL
ncbi:MAG TPA: hypothetical protein VK445_07200, partial [Dissulfurispiraceae bacterium]|nr:hypothetical protein [Dissulfurispiraceae bacterium]